MPAESQCLAVHTRTLTSVSLLWVSVPMAVQIRAGRTHGPSLTDPPRNTPSGAGGNCTCVTTSLFVIYTKPHLLSVTESSLYSQDTLPCHVCGVTALPSVSKKMVTDLLEGSSSGFKPEGITHLTAHLHTPEV